MTEYDGAERSTTERLRALLDERGEHYKTSGNKTWWGRPVDSRTGEYINVYHNQAQPMGDDRLFVEMQLATPEQAVAATLGRGTCRMEGSWHGTTEVYEYRCTSCDEYAHIEVVKPDGAQPPRYCPNCGRMVVNEQ